MNQRVRVGWVTAFFVLSTVSCSEKTNYRLRIVFPSDQARSATERLTVWALDAQGMDCDKLMGGLQKPEEGVEKAKLVFQRPLSAGGMLRRVGVGDTLFFAEGEGLGVVLVRGCALADIRAGASAEVKLELGCVCNPGSGDCAPRKEQMGNGVDDDCDGLTDECTTDDDCADGNSCTVDVCSAGKCVNRTVADGTACSLRYGYD